MGSLNDRVPGQTADLNGKFQRKIVHEEINSQDQEYLSSLYDFCGEYHVHTGLKKTEIIIPSSKLFEAVFWLFRATSKSRSAF